MLFTARSLECSCIKYQQLAYQSSVLCLGRLGINNSFCNGDGIRIHRLTSCTRLWHSSQPRLEVYDPGEHWQIERKLHLDSRQLFKYRQEQLQLQPQPQEALLIITNNLRRARVTVRLRYNDHIEKFNFAGTLPNEVMVYQASRLPGHGLFITLLTTVNTPN